MHTGEDMHQNYFEERILAVSSEFDIDTHLHAVSSQKQKQEQGKVP